MKERISNVSNDLRRSRQEVYLCIKPVNALTLRLRSTPMNQLFTFGKTLAIPVSKDLRAASLRYYV